VLPQYRSTLEGLRVVKLQPSDLPGSVPFVGSQVLLPTEPKSSTCCTADTAASHVVGLAGERSVLADHYRDSIGEAVGSAAIVTPSEAVAKGITPVPVAHVLAHEAVVLHLLARRQRSPRVNSRRGSRLSGPSAKLVYSVEAIFRVGAADIVFYTLSEHPRFPVATESRLLTLLYDRAKAHKL
jgi:hypothetical protein